MELSFIKRVSEHSRIAQIKYLRLLVQEFAVQVDQGFLNAVLTLTSTEEGTKPYTIHLSFSQGGSSGGKKTNVRANAKAKEPAQPPPIQSEFVNVFLKSVGVTVTEIQDVVFKYVHFYFPGFFCACAH
ncbi:unnamed protein product [Gongylonema pulchrum]|uniref:Rep_fac_C domain-containing protein n=1 Tax=Gongylonema pulchrum TaxID=637853 RepID=A0A183D9S9_9BILA|nr:unnamed protein product [Gongylonema pulchrum]